MYCELKSADQPPIGGTHIFSHHTTQGLLPATTPNMYSQNSSLEPIFLDVEEARILLARHLVICSYMYT